MGTITATAEPAPFRVLLVEDNANNQQVIKLILHSAATEITCAENGLEGVQMYERDSYDLILMDLMMPVMDGFTAIKEIRSLEGRTGRSRTPIVVISAKARPSDVQQSRAAGADEHIAKPVSFYGLLSTLSAVLSREDDDRQQTAR